MSGRRFSDEWLAQVRIGARISIEECRVLAVEIYELRATLATTQAALKDARQAKEDAVASLLRNNEGITRMLHEAEAALKDARAEIAAAERRGMEWAAEIVKRWYGRNSKGAALILDALPPPSDAAPAASEVREMTYSVAQSTEYDP